MPPPPLLLPPPPPPPPPHIVTHRPWPDARALRQRPGWCGPGTAAVTGRRAAAASASGSSALALLIPVPADLVDSDGPARRHGDRPAGRLGDRPARRLGDRRRRIPGPGWRPAQKNTSCDLAESPNVMCVSHPVCTVSSKWGVLPPFTRFSAILKRAVQTVSNRVKGAPRRFINGTIRLHAVVRAAVLSQYLCLRSCAREGWGTASETHLSARLSLLTRADKWCRSVLSETLPSFSFSLTLLCRSALLLDTKYTRASIYGKFTTGIWKFYSALYSSVA
jgi:hypothetical protein